MPSRTTWIAGSPSRTTPSGRPPTPRDAPPEPRRRPLNSPGRPRQAVSQQPRASAQAVSQQPFRLEWETSASEVEAGESFTLTVRMHGIREAGEHGGISVSFPSVTQSGGSKERHSSSSAVVEALDYTSGVWRVTFHQPGATIYHRQGDRQFPAEYLLVESDDPTWSSSDDRTLRLRITPKRGGQFPMQIRGWLCADGYTGLRAEPVRRGRDGPAGLGRGGGDGGRERVRRIASAHGRVRLRGWTHGVPVEPGREPRDPVRRDDMQGVILNAAGLILGDDGNRYAFTPEEWRSEEAAPQTGMRVDFEVRGSDAADIYPVPGAAPTPGEAPPPGKRWLPWALAGGGTLVVLGIVGALVLGVFGQSPAGQPAVSQQPQAPAPAAAAVPAATPPTPIPTATTAPAPTSTPIPTPTHTPLPTNTPTHTPAPASTPIPTATPPPAPTSTPIPTATPTPRADQHVHPHGDADTDTRAHQHPRAHQYIGAHQHAHPTATTPPASTSTHGDAHSHTSAH